MSLRRPRPSGAWRQPRRRQPRVADAAATPTSPPPCTEATLAYDPSSEAMLLLNCVDQTDPGSVEQIWSWDGSAWSLVDDSGPPATVVTGVAFDPERSTAVRYGGLPMDSNDCSTETWEWSASGWASKDVDPPTACDHMFMVHDTARDRSLLFGGGDDAGTLITETWAWDGAAWQEIASEGPSGRAHFGFVYDASHEQALLYGGYDGSAVFDDFWSWDGSTWSEIDFPGPGRRSHLGMACGRRRAAPVRWRQRSLDVRIAARRHVAADQRPMAGGRGRRSVDARFPGNGLRPGSRHVRAVRRLRHRRQPARRHLGVGRRLGMPERLLTPEEGWLYAPGNQSSKGTSRWPVIPTKSRSSATATCSGLRRPRRSSGRTPRRSPP